MRGARILRIVGETTCILTQAHTPTIHKSSAIYMNRYKDCGNGVLEFTSVLHNFEPAVSGDTWTYLNVPWGGIRTSTLNDIVFSQPGGAAGVNKDLDAPMQSWGDDVYLPNLEDTGGFTTFVQDLVCSTCTNFSMPCADAQGAVVACSNPGSAGRLDIRKKSCALAASQTQTYGRDTVRCVIAPTVTVKTGCTSCKLVFTNEASGRSIAVAGVLHWAWAGNQMFFWPDTSVNTVDDVNDVFSTDDVINVSRADYGKRPQDNLALAFVHGTDAEFASASLSGVKFNGKTRLRFGSANAKPRRDYTAFTINSRVDVPPGDTFVTRQFFMVDRLEGLDVRARQFVPQVPQAQFA